MAMTRHIFWSKRYNNKIKKKKKWYENPGSKNFIVDRDRVKEKSGSINYLSIEFLGSYLRSQSPLSM